MPDGLLSDLLVIDCASFIAGPAAATIMSDYGARVIKIEPPGLGDSYRSLFRMRGAAPDDLDYYWTLDSRNKESLALDLKAPAARAVLDALIAKADVFITNFPFPIRERLSLRAEDVLPLNKRLIYASMSPYGEEGPERDRTAYDTTAWWARSGLMDMVRATMQTELAVSMPGMGDHPTATALYAAIMTALYRRQMTGEGGQVTTSLLANGLWSNACQIQASLCGYELAGRGRRGERSALTDIYQCGDGRHFMLAIANPGREWPLLARALGQAEWLSEPMFATGPARMANAAVLGAFLEDAFAQQPWEHWRELLTRAGITFGIVGRIDDHIADPQCEANGLLPEFTDGLGLKTVDSPFQLVGEEKVVPKMAPAVGQHTRAILEELGLGADEVEGLMGAG